jgi:hypothetical protein
MRHLAVRQVNRQRARRLLGWRTGCITLVYRLMTVRDMVKAAQELRVPLYDDRLGWLEVRELSEGRLVYDPVSGLVARQVTGGDGR